MTSNSTVSLGAVDGTTPSALSTTYAYTLTYASLVVWPSLVLALSSIAIAVVGINDASSSQSKCSLLRRNDLGGHGLLAQIALLVCATILRASSVFFASTSQSSFPRSAVRNDDAPPDPRELHVLNASIYLTVFVNILCNLVSVSSTGFLNGTTAAKYRYCHPSADMMLVRSMSIANLGPVVYSILLIMESGGSGKEMNLHLRNNNQWHMMMMSYAVAFVLVQSIQGLIKKRRGQRSVLAGIPLVNGYRYGRESEGASMPPPRPDGWHEWSAEEVARWVSSLPQLGSSGPNSMAYNDGGFSIGRSKFKSRESNQHYASLLQEECVDGTALAGISIDTLRSFGLPYGHAAALRRIVDSELVSRYGIGDLQLHGDALRHNGTLFDSNGLEGTSGALSGHDGAAIPMNSIAPDIAEKASELFAERFGGMKLASFETGESSTSSSGVSQRDPPRRMVGLDYTNSKLDTVEEEGAGVTDDEQQVANPVKAPPAHLSEALLSSLPSNVRGVAMRRPELFRSMLLQSRGIGAAAGTGFANDNVPVATGSSGTASEVEMASYGADGDDDEEASSSETVGLLRRRPPR